MHGAGMKTMGTLSTFPCLSANRCGTHRMGRVCDPNWSTTGEDGGEFSGIFYVEDNLTSSPNELK